MLKKDYWQKRQLLYLRAFKDALPILQQKSIKKKVKYINEDDISRDLYLALGNVIFNGRYKHLQLGLPNFQTQSQPNLKDKRKAKREDKRPDFLWTYIDYVNRDRRDFYAECKRLKEDKTYHCREYVKNGLNRFLEKDWSYGFGCENGLMIGYVEEISINDCLSKIKEYLKETGIPSIAPYQKAGKNKSYLKHTLNRKNIHSLRFDLYHYLVEI